MDKIEIHVFGYCLIKHVECRSTTPVRTNRQVKQNVVLINQKIESLNISNKITPSKGF